MGGGWRPIRVRVPSSSYSLIDVVISGIGKQVASPGTAKSSPNQGHSPTAHNQHTFLLKPCDGEAQRLVVLWAMIGSWLVRGHKHGRACGEWAIKLGPAVGTWSVFPCSNPWTCTPNPGHLRSLRSGCNCVERVRCLRCCYVMERSVEKTAEAINIQYTNMTGRSRRMLR
jgi:hypothetical protein